MSDCVSCEPNDWRPEKPVKFDDAAKVRILENIVKSLLMTKCKLHMSDDLQYSYMYQMSVNDMAANKHCRLGIKPIEADMINLYISD